MNSSTMPAVPVTLGNREYVILPRDEYEKLAGLPAGTVDGVAFAAAAVAKGLRAAREHAKLSQSELAKKLRKSQSMVARTETGTVAPNERYVASVMKACGLPRDWNYKQL